MDRACKSVLANFGALYPLLSDQFHWIREQVTGILVTRFSSSDSAKHVLIVSCVNVNCCEFYQHCCFDAYHSGERRQCHSSVCLVLESCCTAPISPGDGFPGIPVACFALMILQQLQLITIMVPSYVWDHEQPIGWWQDTFVCLRCCEAVFVGCNWSSLARFQGDAACWSCFVEFQSILKFLVGHFWQTSAWGPFETCWGCWAAINQSKLLTKAWESETLLCQIHVLHRFWSTCTRHVFVNVRFPVTLACMSASWVGM